MTDVPYTFTASSSEVLTTLSAYTRYRDYSDFQAENPDTEINGADLDADFDRIKVTTDRLMTALAQVRKDDGQVKNASVGVDQLKSDVISLLNGVTPRGAWVTATSYAIGDIVNQGGGTYIGLLEHTSGTFATDLAAGKWMTLSALTAAASVAFTPAGAVSATDVQSAIEELDAEKQPIDATLTALAALTGATNKIAYFNGSDTAALADFTAAARTLVACASVGAMLTALGAVASDGSVAMTGELELSGNPSGPLSAVPKQYVDGVSGAPVGSVVAYAGSSAPSGYLLCDASAVSRTTYAALFAVVGTTYGAGNGTTTFNVPDLRGRFIAGVDGGAARLGSGATGGITGAATLAATGGQQSHTMTSGELVAHTHGAGSYAAAVPYNAGGIGAANTLAPATDNAGTSSVSVTGTSSSTGSTTAFNVTPPTLVLNYIIRV